MDLKVVGRITFDGRHLDVYESLDNPIFKAKDVAKLIGYSSGNTWKMAELCEEDEKQDLPMVVAGQTRMFIFVTEAGLYNILAQSRKPIARKWRKVVFDELIRMRKKRGVDVLQQFDEWDEMLENLYYDEGTGKIMMSVTTHGGDVEQVAMDC